MATECYGPVGECIYCGALPPPKLGKEHIVPLALGGELILLESSCKACGEITGRFEGLVLRGGLRGIKERLAYSSRSKDRPKTLPLFVGEGGGSRIDVAVEDYPATIILPHIVGPTLAPFPGAATAQRPPWGYIPPTDWGKLVADHGVTTFASNSIDAFAFARMLAKIAHSWAVAQLGKDGFMPFLLPLILSNEQCDYRRFMGTMELMPELPEELPRNRDYTLLLADEGVAGQEYVTALIQLFGQFGSPFYRVVVGQRKEQFGGTKPGCEGASDELRGLAYQRVQFSISNQ